MFNAGLPEDPDLIADIVQMTFIVGFKRIETFKDHTNPDGIKAWMIRIANYIFKDQRRRQWKERYHCVYESDEGGESALETYFDSNSATPEELVVALEIEVAEKEKLERAIQTLSTWKQVIYRAVRLQNKPVKDIAKRYNLSNAGVYRLLSRADEKLRRLLKPNHNLPIKGENSNE